MLGVRCLQRKIWNVLQNKLSPKQQAEILVIIMTLCWCRLRHRRCQCYVLSFWRWLSGSRNDRLRLSWSCGLDSKIAGNHDNCHSPFLPLTTNICWMEHWQLSSLSSDQPWGRSAEVKRNIRNKNAASCKHLTDYGLSFHRSSDRAVISKGASATGWHSSCQTIRRCDSQGSDSRYAHSGDYY